MLSALLVRDAVELYVMSSEIAVANDGINGEMMSGPPLLAVKTLVTGNVELYVTPSEVYSETAVVMIVESGTTGAELGGPWLMTTEVTGIVEL